MPIRNHPHLASSGVPGEGLDHVGLHLVRIVFNPVLIKKEGTIKEFEGCLSVPEFYEPVKRAKKVWMRAMTLEGKTVEVKGEGLLSRIFQHEIDHLNGILFVDRLGVLKSRRIKKKLTQRALLPKA